MRLPKSCAAGSSGSASGFQGPLDAGPDLVGRDKFAVLLRSSQPEPHRFRKTGFIIEKTINRLADKVVCSASIAGGKFGEPGFLIWVQLNFPILRLG
jgi:hypothetical protein